MTIVARGVGKKVAYKKESAWGTLAGASGAKYIRRVTSTFNLKKDVYESAEIRTDYQVADSRHGIRSVDGAINGELSPGSYSDFMQSVVARDFAAVTAATGLSVTIATSGSLFTVARSAGSWLTDGFRVGQVIRLSGGSLNVANQANNLLICAITSALSMTVKVLSTTTLVAEGPIATVTATVQGKTTYAPLSGHTDDSYTIEEWYSDIAQSEVYTGLKVGSMAVQLPATGMVTTDFSFKGKNLEQTGTAQYFTTPTNANTNGITTAVQGVMLVGGVPVALITSMDFSVERGLEAANVVGSNFAADVFTGRIKATGNMSTYFIDNTYRDYYNNETPISIVVALTTDGTKTAQCLTFTLPRVKLGSADKNDGESGLVQSHTFTALLNSDTATGLEATTIQINDTTI